MARAGPHPRRARHSGGTECEWRCAWSWPLDVLSQLVLRRRHPPRDLLPGLLKLARQVGVPPLEVLLLFLKPQNLGTQPPELAAQRFDVGAVAVGLRRRPRRRCRHPSDRDLLVGRPVLLSSRRGIPGPLDASAHLMALLERDGAGRDFPLMGLVPRLRQPWPWARPLTFPLLFGLGPADDVNDQDDDVGHDEPRPRSLERLTSKLE